MTENVGNAPQDPNTRMVTMDIHRHYAKVGVFDKRMEELQPIKQVKNEYLENWMQKNLRREDWVAIESTSNAWHVYDQLRKYVDVVKVANPHKVQLIAAAAVKTDNQAVKDLAQLLALGWLPEVWVPDMPTRELRGLIAHRSSLVGRRAQIRNGLQSVLQRHNIVPPTGGLFSQENRGWWKSLKLSDIEMLRLDQGWREFEQISALIDACEVQIKASSTDSDWREHSAFLMQFTGIGVQTAVTVLSAIGDISRFPTAKKLVGYSGMGTYVHNSGKTQHNGPISKRGRAELRTAMVEAAWTAVDHDAYWRAQYERLCRRKSPPTAIVAIARRMLVEIWKTWSKHVVNAHGDDVKIATKIRRWASELNAQQRRGESIADFTRTELDRLHTATDVTEVPNGNRKPFKLPPSKLHLPANGA
jgi:transposase